MNDNILSTLNSLKCFSDKMLSCLNKNLNCYIVGNVVVFNKLTADFVFCFRRTRKTDFNFLKAHIAKCVEKFELFFKVHRIDKCLVTVTKVNTAPDRCFCYSIVWPLSVRQINLLKGNVLFK